MVFAVFAEKNDSPHEDEAPLKVDNQKKMR